MKLTYETYKGKKIMRVNFNECASPEELEELAYKLRDEVVSSSGNLLILNNYEGVFLNPQFMNKVKELAKAAQGKVDKSAVIGVGGVKRILLNGYNAYAKRNVKAFDTADQAKEYLVS